MRVVSVLVAALLLAGCGNFYPGDPVENKPHFTAALKGDSPGWANLTASFSPSRRILHWSLDYRGLSGPITWAEFRGPDIEGTIRRSCRSTCRSKATRIPARWF